MKNILFVLLIVVCHTTFAQDSLKVKRYDYKLSIYAGPQSIGVGALNDVLVSNGISKLRSTALVIGTSHTVFRSRSGFGTSADLITTPTQSSGNRNSRLMGYAFSVFTSYYIIEKTNFTLYPTIGVRNVVMNAKIAERDAVSNIGDVLTQSHRNSTITYRNTLLDVGLGASFKSELRTLPWKCPQGERYIAFDIKVGYNFVINKDNGEYNGTVITDGPSVSSGGLYARIGIGFGARLRRVSWK
jgi:hypothetical protein